MKAIRIATTGVSSATTRITTEDGQEVGGVTGAVIRIDPNQPVICELRIFTAVVDVLAHPLLDLATLRESAAVHGFRLVPALTVAPKD